MDKEQPIITQEHFSQFIPWHYQPRHDRIQSTPNIVSNIQGVHSTVQHREPSATDFHNNVQDSESFTPDTQNTRTPTLLLATINEEENIEIGVPDLQDHAQIGRTASEDREQGHGSSVDGRENKKLNFWCRSARRKWCLCCVVLISLLVTGLMSAIITLQVMYFTGNY